MLRFAWALAFLCAVASGGRTAHADDLSDFETARRAYRAGDYARAARGFEALVGGVVPKTRNPVIRIESRKYLGASYLFLGKKTEARAQFRALLEEDENYVLDPVSFPKAVNDVFADVKTDFAAELERKRAAQAERERAAREQEMAGLIAQQERIRRLEELAMTETVEERNSRWIAALPFGVGQFRNGHKRGGIWFATLQSAFLVASVGTFLGHNSLRGATVAPDRIADARKAEKILRISNWVSVGALVGTYLGSVIDAELRFKPTIEKTRKRELPPDLRSRRLRFGLALGGGSLRLDF